VVLAVAVVVTFGPARLSRSAEVGK
jgi:hypothetical protein